MKEEDVSFNVFKLYRFMINLTKRLKALYNKVVKIDLSDYRSNQIELFAKGLFSFLAQDGALRYLLLWFGSDKSIAEFIRISSVFYNRMGVSDIIQGRQIALCSMDEETKLPILSKRYFKTL